MDNGQSRRLFAFALGSRSLCGRDSAHQHITIWFSSPQAVRSPGSFSNSPPSFDIAVKSFHALALAAFVAVASADEFPQCDRAILNPIISSPTGTECNHKLDAAVNVTAAPTPDLRALTDTPPNYDAWLDVLCLDAACIAFVGDLTAALPKECYTNPDKLLYRDFITKRKTECKATGKTLAPTPAPTTATPEPTTKPVPTTVTPEPTKPVPTTATPEPTKPVPTTARPQC